jgi:hypothetical protein
MRLTDMLPAGVQHLGRREGVIVLGVNEEDRRRDVVNGQEPRSQIRTTIEAIPSSGKDCHRSQDRFTINSRHLLSVGPLPRPVQPLMAAERSASDGRGRDSEDAQVAEFLSRNNLRSELVRSGATLESECRRVSN